MASLKILIFGLKLSLLVTRTLGQFSALPTEPGVAATGATGTTENIALPGATKLPTPTIIYTFSLPQTVHDLVEKPEILGLSKRRGILAGGGVLKVTGKKFDLFKPINVTFNLIDGSKVLPGSINDGSITAEEFYLTTPGASTTDLNQEFIIKVEFANYNLPVDIPGSFFYTNNPTVSVISPVNPLIVFRGGARLTLIGTNLDIPTKTTIRARLEIFVNLTGIFSRDGNSTCNPHNETAVHCPMPDFNLPRNASWLNISDEVNKSMEVNVTQDSYFPKGRNIIPSFHPPIIIGTSEVFYFDTMLGESLKIEAKEVEASTTSLADYRVEVGNINCTMTHMETNLLECMPPENPPLVSQSSLAVCNSEGMSVFVSAFDSRQFSKCIKYYNSRRPLIIGLSIAAIILIAIVAIVLFVLMKKISCPNSIPNSLKIPSKAYGSMKSGIVNPRVQSIYAQEFDNVELESSGTSFDTEAKIEDRSSDAGSEEEERDSNGAYMQPTF